jgi:hypothetical protein
MPGYRFYMMSTDGHIAGPPKVVDCVEDEEAIGHARNLVDSHVIEVWEQGSVYRKD